MSLQPGSGSGSGGAPGLDLNSGPGPSMPCPLGAVGLSSGLWLQLSSWEPSLTESSDVFSGERGGRLRGSTLEPGRRPSWEGDAKPPGL